MKRVSVAICTRNRASSIVACLDSVARSLRASRLTSGEFELLVVDNGSTDSTPQVIRNWHVNNPDIDIRCVDEPIAGLAQARNKALEEISADLVIFTDDDCHLAEDYILKALAYDAQDTADVIRGGRIELGNPADIPLTIKTSDQSERYSKSSRSGRKSDISGFISGCNMVMRKSVLDKLGKFDAHLGAGSSIPGSEDTDYLMRAYLCGIDVEYVPDMTVYHFHGRKTSADGKKLLGGYNMGAGALFIKYLLRDIDLFRPFIWNIRNAVSELRTGKNLYLPEYDMSYRDVVKMNIIGMWRYVCGRVSPLGFVKSLGKQE